jgi:hypothetical protein
MISKICFKCNIDKPLYDYYKHKQTRDGHLNKCKLCTKKDTKKRVDALSKDPAWVEKEQERNRKKYFRLGYKDKHKPTFEQRKKSINKYIEKYPEKLKAKSFLGKKIKSENGHFHHWSYNQEHWLDVIDITKKNHAKAHRFIIYDQEQMMYRRIDTNELLDSKEKHLEWINWCIKNKTD